MYHPLRIEAQAANLLKRSIGLANIRMEVVVLWPRTPSCHDNHIIGTCQRTKPTRRTSLFSCTGLLVRYMDRITSRPNGRINIRGSLTTAGTLQPSISESFPSNSSGVQITGIGSQASVSTRSYSFCIDQLLIFFPLHRSAILIDRNQLIWIAQVLITEDDNVRESLNSSL